MMLKILLEIISHRRCSGFISKTVRTLSLFTRRLKVFQAVHDRLRQRTSERLQPVLQCSQLYTETGLWTNLNVLQNDALRDCPHSHASCTIRYSLFTSFSDQIWHFPDASAAAFRDYNSQSACPAVRFLSVLMISFSRWKRNYPANVVKNVIFLIITIIIAFFLCK